MIFLLISVIQLTKTFNNYY